MFVIETHFHSRWTGVTSHVVDISSDISNKVKCVVFGYGFRGRVKSISLRSLIREIRNQPEVVWHAHRNIEALVGLVLKKYYRNIRVVYTRHSAGKPSFITKFALKASDLVLSLNENMQQTLGMPSMLVPHGVSLPVNVRPITLDRDSVVISVIGRVRSKKGQLDIVKALSSIENIGKRITLQILGKCQRKDKSYLNAILNEAKQNASVMVEVIGEVDDIEKFYLNSDMVIVTSYTEGFSMVPLEAMSYACPVIATDGVGIHGQLVKHNETGWLYSAGNITELANLIKTALHDEDLRALIGRKARLEIQSHWTIAHESELMLKEYRHLFSV